MEYSVKLNRFEGPYTKLLSLIEERKLSITEIDLASLADDYIAYTKSLREKDYLDISLFIVVASTLMLMKVKSLLPKVDYTDNEEKQIEDLTHKLFLLAYLEENTKKLASLFKKKSFISYGKIRLKKKEGSMPKNITTSLLLRSAKETLEQNERESYIKEVTVTRKIHIEDVTRLIRISEKNTTSLREISNQIKDERGLILSFLSILELVRLGEFLAHQETIDDIIIERTSLMLQ